MTRLTEPELDIVSSLRPARDDELRLIADALATRLAICDELGEPLGSRILDLIEVAK
jgi:hypothetical protein